MTKTRCISIGKFEKNALNEDAVIARKNILAVSDGAGGGGLFADRWSKYLLSNIPTHPLTSAEELDEWIGSIWEAFYNKAESSAKRLGGLALDKFYDEGSFATLAAVWKTDDNTCEWMTYGDSVVFCYDYATKSLQHTFTTLADFNKSPYLINCKDELDPSGFKHGKFHIKKTSMVFATSDALAHYILMVYELSNIDKYGFEITDASHQTSKNSNYIKNGLLLSSMKFEKEVIGKIRKAVYNQDYCRKWLSSIYNRGLLAHDDYSIALMHF